MYWFKMRTSWDRPIKKLTNEEAGILIKAVLDYVNTGEEPELEGGADLVMSMISSVLEEDFMDQEEAWAEKRKRARQKEKRVEIARKGAEARWRSCREEEETDQTTKQEAYMEASGEASAEAYAYENAEKCHIDKIQNKIQTEIQNTDYSETETERRSAAQRKEREADCSEQPSADSELPVAEIPLNDGSIYPVYRKEAEEYAGLYPAVDVYQVLRSIVGWCRSNPQRRKTKRGVKKFINSWMSREQDRGGTRPAVPSNPYLAEARGENPYGPGMIGGMDG